MTQTGISKHKDKDSFDMFFNAAMEAYNRGRPTTEAITKQIKIEEDEG
jgi:hypothetical protein